MRVGGQRNAPDAIRPGKRPGTYFIGGWVGPRASLRGCAKSPPQLATPPPLCTLSVLLCPDCAAYELTSFIYSRPLTHNRHSLQRRNFWHMHDVYTYILLCGYVCKEEFYLIFPLSCCGMAWWRPEWGAETCSHLTRIQSVVCWLYICKFYSLFFMCRLSRNSGASTSWKPQGPVQACSEKALPFYSLINCKHQRGLIKLKKYVSYVCCALCRHRPLRQADQSSRGVLPSVCVCVCVIRCTDNPLHLQWDRYKRLD